MSIDKKSIMICLNSIRDLIKETDIEITITSGRYEINWNGGIFQFSTPSELLKGLDSVLFLNENAWNS